ncbi:MAG: flagellar hook-associated protein FlgK, partial [Rickettsiales bacterium]|nr:flagellar hook-associated protein FlgK [Rickettsiales bacterium]
MTLSVALNKALSGLNVNQQQLSVLSQNIANANTQGYSKQVAQQDSVYLKGQGQGVSITEVIRKIDDYLNKSVQRQGSLVASTGVVDDYSTRIQLLMGNPGNKNSIDSYINTFYNTVQSLSQSPQNTTLQQTAVNAAITLSNEISGLSNSLRDLQYQADQDVAKGIDEVNISLKRLAELNQLVASNVSLGKSVADLEDQRDKTIQKISEYINVSTFNQRNGNISATTGNGVTILDNSPYQLDYTPAASAVTFSDGSPLGAITVSRFNSEGARVGVPVILANSDIPANISSVFSSGKLAGLMQMRDEQLPNIIAQLDNLAAAMRDQFNAIHNSGSGYPGAEELSGNRPVFSQQVNQWSGQTRIAVLDSNGQPVASPYADEPYGFAPLTLNLEKMDSGNGVGNPSVQSIIDTINQYYGVPQAKMKLGNLNNIQLISNTAAIPSTPPQLSFDFNLSNISGKQADFFVTNVTVTNNVGTLLTPVTSTLPSVALAGLGTYTTTAGSNTVTVAAATSHGLYEGQTVYLSTPPGGPYDGIPASALGGYFTISNITPT